MPLLLCAWVLRGALETVSAWQQRRQDPPKDPRPAGQQQPPTWRRVTVLRAGWLSACSSQGLAVTAAVSPGRREPVPANAYLNAGCSFSVLCPGAPRCLFQTMGQILPSAAPVQPHSFLWDCSSVAVKIIGNDARFCSPLLRHSNEFQLNTYFSSSLKKKFT